MKKKPRLCEKTTLCDKCGGPIEYVEALICEPGSQINVQERVLRPLTPFLDQPDLLRRAWDVANTMSGGKPTSRTAIEEPTP